MKEEEDIEKSFYVQSPAKTSLFSIATPDHLLPFDFLLW